MSFFPITSSKSLVDARIDYVFLLVLEKKSYASFLSYLRTVPKGSSCVPEDFKIVSCISKLNA